MSADASPGSVEPASERIVPPAWKVVAGVVAALLLAAGVVLLVARAAGFAEVRAAVEVADAAWLALCVLAQAVSLAGYAAVIRGAFRWDDGVEPGFRGSARVMLASIGATRVFAAGGVGALAAAYWSFRCARFARREAAVRVLGFNTLFYVVFGAGAWLSALLLATRLWGSAPPGLTAPWLVAVPACVLAAAFVTAPERVERLTGGRPFFLRRALGLAVAGTAWVRSVLLTRAGAPLLVAASVYWLGSILCFWAALRSVDESLPLPELVIAFATGHAAMLLPLPLGGVGGVDAALTFSLTLVGVPLAPALVAVAVYRLVAFWMPTPPALVALALLPRTGRALERAAPAT